MISPIWILSLQGFCNLFTCNESLQCVQICSFNCDLSKLQASWCCMFGTRNLKPCERYFSWVQLPQGHYPGMGLPFDWHLPPQSAAKPQQWPRSPASDWYQAWNRYSTASVATLMASQEETYGLQQIILFSFLRWSTKACYVTKLLTWSPHLMACT